MGFLSRSAAQKGWLAVRVWTDRVCVAHVLPVPEGKPRIVLCQMHTLEGSPTVLKRLARDLQVRQHKVTCLLNAGEYQLLLVEAPNVAEDELRAAVRWRIKEQIDYPVDAATLDILHVPQDRNNPTRTASVYVAVAHNTLIAARQILLEDARFPLSVIDIPELAQRNLAACLEEPDRGYALLSFDAAGGLLTFTCNGGLYLARRIDVGFSQIVLNSEEQRERVFERIALDVQRTIDHFDRQFRSIALGQLVLALIPVACGLETYLASNLSVSVVTVALDAFFELSAVADSPEWLSAEQQAECLLTLGASLRIDP